MIEHLDMPDVSVIVPTHNRSELLRRTLTSVLRQEGVSLEVVVVDDGSSDDTQAVVRGIADERIRYVRHETAVGVSVARNHGAERAQARWLAFVDDDDLWAPAKLSSQLAAARATGRAWVITGSVNITMDDVVVGGAPPLEPASVAERLPSANVVPGGCSGVLLDREALDGAEPFDAGYRHFADWDLWIRLSRRGIPAAVARPYVGYRIHATNASHDTGGMVAELDVIERRYGGSVDRVGFLRHVARVSRRGGRRRQALAYYLRAASALDPGYLLGPFPRDVGEVVGAALRERLGRLPNPAASERRRNAAWLAEGQAWIEALDARPPASAGDPGRSP